MPSRGGLIFGTLFLAEQPGLDVTPRGLWLVPEPGIRTPEKLFALLSLPVREVHNIRSNTVVSHHGEMDSLAETLVLQGQPSPEECSCHPHTHHPAMTALAHELFPRLASMCLPVASTRDNGVPRALTMDSHPPGTS